MHQFLISSGVPSSSITGIVSAPDTLGNIRALYVTSRMRLKDKTVGLLTNFYHTPRVMRIAHDPQFDWRIKFVPLCAESIVPSAVEHGTINAATLASRIDRETAGLRDWEEGTYIRQHLPNTYWLGAVYE